MSTGTSPCGSKICGGAVWIVFTSLGACSVIAGGALGSNNWTPLAIGLITAGALAVAGGCAGLAFMRCALVQETKERDSLIEGVNTIFRGTVDNDL